MIVTSRSFGILSNGMEFYTNATGYVMKYITFNS